MYKMHGIRLWVALRTAAAILSVLWNLRFSHLAVLFQCLWKSLHVKRDLQSELWLIFIQNIFLLACLLTLVLYYIADLMPNAWDLTFDAIFFIEKYSLWKIPLVHIKFDARFSSPFSPLSQWNHIKYEDWFHLNDSTDSNNDKKRQMKLVGCNKQRHCHQACV